MLKDEKKLFLVSEIKHINVPKCPEINVKKIVEMVKDQPDIAPYLPSNITKKRGISREHLMNIVNTVYPQYLPQIIRFAQDERQVVDAELEKNDAILVSDEWFDRIK